MMMKKLSAITIMILASAMLMASSVRWSPSVGAYAGYKADGLQDYMSSSAAIGIELDLATISIDDHTISLPFSIGYSTIGNEHDYVRKQAEMLLSLEARYFYRLSDLLSIGAGAGIRGQWHLGTEYLSMSVGGSLIPSFRILDSLSLTVPLSFYASRNDCSLMLGIGLSFHFMEAI